MCVNKCTSCTYFGERCSIPALEDEEELEDNGGGSCVGIELAGAGHQHGPGHAPQVAQDVGVDTSTCRRGQGHSHMYAHTLHTHSLIHSFPH